jgi:hypothetical protein
VKASSSFDSDFAERKDEVLEAMSQVFEMLRELG